MEGRCLSRRTVLIVRIERELGGERIIADSPPSLLLILLTYSNFTADLHWRKRLLSGMGQGSSGSNLESLAGSGNWLEGMRFSGSVSEADLQAWIDSLK